MRARKSSGTSPNARARTSVGWSPGRIAPSAPMNSRCQAARTRAASSAQRSASPLLPSTRAILDASSAERKKYAVETCPRSLAWYAAMSVISSPGTFHSPNWNPVSHR